MRSETVSIKVERYRTPDGTPTCASGFQDGHVCRFYVTRAFGTKEECVFGGDLRRDQGWLVPLQECPVWKAES